MWAQAIYDQGWDKLFAPLVGTLKKFKYFLLVTDGDASILKGLGNKVEIIFQRCLWHIPHQLKYCPWQDKVKHKSDVWLTILATILEICSTPKLPEEQFIDKLVSRKKELLDGLIAFCRDSGFMKSAVYLENARPDMFTALENRLRGKTSSRAERVMRTVNMRINVGKWSEAGALNVNKVRLAYYYNGFDVG